ncbi:molybdopterin molybdotransferase MoeA [Geobacter pelophilus]|uniref:Molybdopterin molybdenumtransferase n=1 Tax=Geoanaerobacter pelophilus TaxID=60036 RepID=A0AAW4L259_9BACT|nr:gephyrin-like molybdotransferase Glp [Geoanaerobacter pelophilus]MBT0664277.1 molybdopterin molybdotransferase MoeA [Geoanaerobacter pelophilus]
MVSIEEAQKTIFEQISPLETERVSAFQGLNRVTPEDHIAPWDIPPADNSAMDGYAFSHASLKGERLRVTGFLPAGEERDAPVPPGEAVKIMTGAPVPPGCDTVVPIEDVEQLDQWIRLTSPAKAGAHIRKRGEDIRLGDIVIPAGSTLRPQEIGMLSAMGVTTLAVHRRARVAVLATGDELLEPGSTPAPGKIINSNSYSLAAQVLDAGGDPVLLGIAPDSLEATCDKIRGGLNADLLVITGGVSVGDRDFVKMAIEHLGGAITFWKVNMKPGKPLAFAMLNGTPVFALPGNPVAAMVSFELFVRPAILKAMGRHRILRPKVRAALLEPAANKGKRPHLVRGLVSKGDNGYVVSLTGNQSSGRLSSLIQGNGLVYLAPEAVHGVGDVVDVLLLDREFEMGEVG